MVNGYGKLNQDSSTPIFFFFKKLCLTLNFNQKLNNHTYYIDQQKNEFAPFSNKGIVERYLVNIQSITV